MSRYEMTCPQCAHRYEIRYPYCSRSSDDPKVHARYAAQARGDEPAPRCGFCREFGRLQQQWLDYDSDAWRERVLKEFRSSANIEYVLTVIDDPGFEPWLRTVDVVALAEPLGHYERVPRWAACAVLDWRGEPEPQRWLDHDAAQQEAWAKMFTPVPHNQTHKTKPINPNDLPKDLDAFKVTDDIQSKLADGMVTPHEFKVEPLKLPEGFDDIWNVTYDVLDRSDDE